MITQTRLSMRLDAYLQVYMEKYTETDPFSNAGWDKAWEAAKIARVQQTLTPELVDNVRIALHTL